MAYRVKWGEQSKDFSAEQLKNGINLPVEFLINPFTAQFNKVAEAVAAKQAFETDEIKKKFRSLEATTDLAAVTAEAEKTRSELVTRINASFQPVVHTLSIQAL